MLSLAGFPDCKSVQWPFNSILWLWSIPYCVFSCHTHTPQPVSHKILGRCNNICVGLQEWRLIEWCISEQLLHSPPPPHLPLSLFSSSLLGLLNRPNIFSRAMPDWWWGRWREICSYLASTHTISLPNTTRDYRQLPGQTRGHQSRHDVDRGCAACYSSHTAIRYHYLASL